MKKGSILIMSLWVLAMLALFAVSVSSRASLELKLAHYQKKSLAAHYLAQAALYRAIAELHTDTNMYDAPDESWANNEAVFKNISFDDVVGEAAQVSYRDRNNTIIFGVQDEAARININRAPAALLQQLFLNTEFSIDALLLTETITQWRSSEPEAGENKVIFKNAPLSVPEELIVILEYFYNDKGKAFLVYDNIKDFITVYGADTLNINTVSRQALVMLGNALSDSNERQYAGALTQRILEARKAKGHFSRKEDIGIIPASEEESLFDKILNNVSFRSNIFRIQAQGSAGGVIKTITVVYDRLNKKMLYRHQN